MLDTSSKRIIWKFFDLFKAEVGAKKKASIISDEEFTGFDGIIVRPRVIKSQDHD